jgi:protocatechuate 3,4-dioxygenase alpha subunit
VSTRLVTPSQTVGPFFHDCLLRRGGLRESVTEADVEGARVRIHGMVYDGDGAGVPDALIEAWQGDRFARTGTAASGSYSFATIHPAAVLLDLAGHAPCISLAVFARGLLNHLYTRIYFPGEPANATDPVLLRVPRPRRATLIAVRDSDETEQVYRFDIVLQGRDETVFFDYR